MYLDLHFGLQTTWSTFFVKQVQSGAFCIIVPGATVPLDLGVVPRHLSNAACICTGSRQIGPRKISSNKITKICFDSFQWRISNDWGSRRMFPSLFPFIGLSSILRVTERKYYPFRNHLWKYFSQKFPLLPALPLCNEFWLIFSIADALVVITVSGISPTSLHHPFNQHYALKPIKQESLVYMHNSLFAQKLLKQGKQYRQCKQCKRCEQ